MTDDGFGMDAAWLVALNRTADVSSTQGGEHGLGLKLVRQIAKAPGGTIQFQQAVPYRLKICPARRGCGRSLTARKDCSRRSSIGWWLHRAINSGRK